MVKSKKAPKYKSPLEEQTAKQLDDDYTKFEYEPDKLPYTIPETEHTYTPDFKIEKIFGDIMYLECKGAGPRYGLTLDTRKKMLYVKFKYPNLDIRFVFQNPYFKINKGSKTTYAMWAEKNGFKWCGSTIPKEWLKEMRGRD